jgi:hypothetical protein
MSFIAKYHGPCTAGDHISPGDLVKYDDDDELVHINCDIPSLPNARDDLNAVCRNCWTIHQGECL